jgi:hypothetical protein
MVTYMKKQCVYIAIPADKLSSLLLSGQIHAADINCLNEESKRLVWTLLLNLAGSMSFKHPFSKA